MSGNMSKAAAGALAALAIGSQLNKDAIALPSLVIMLHSDPFQLAISCNPGASKPCCRLWRQQDCYPQHALSALASLLKSDHDEVCKQAAIVIANLASDSQPGRDAIVTLQC